MFGYILWLTRALEYLAGISLPSINAANDMPPATADVIEQTARSLGIAVWVVVISVGALAMLFFFLKIRNELAKGGGMQGGDATAFTIDSALKSERKGDFVKAAMNYEALGDDAKAAALYEKGRDFSRAAALYEKLGKNDKAVMMYKKSGESLKAAALHMRARNYAEAAKIFKNKGDTLRAAKAFEMMGNKLAAAREYAEAGQYVKSARMYKDERMYAEAGEVYAMALGDGPMVPANIGMYYTYAAFLVMSGELVRAGETYKAIASVDGSFKDVQEKLRLIGLRTGQIASPELAIDRKARVRDEHEELKAKSSAPAEAAPEVMAPEPAPVEEPSRADKPVDISGHAAVLEDLSMPEPAPPSPEPPVEQPLDQPMDEPIDQTVPSARVEFSPSLDAATQEIADKVMQQDDIDDLFDKEGGGGAEAEASGAEDKTGETTLRSMLNSGRMDPRYSMRMWMQILKQLYEKHSSGVYYGSIPPESIHIDMENNVRLDDPGRQQAEYTAPEVLTGSAPDEQTDVYAMGVILYEMTTGTAETIGEMSPMEAYDDVPEWMDEMIMRCIEKKRDARYRGLDDISSLVLQRAANS